MTHMQFLNILMATILSMALLMAECIGYKMMYDLRPYHKDEFMIFLGVLQWLVVYAVLTKLKFNQGATLWHTL